MTHITHQIPSPIYRKGPFLYWIVVQDFLPPLPILIPIEVCHVIQSYGWLPGGFPWWVWLSLGKTSNPVRTCNLARMMAVNQRMQLVLLPVVVAHRQIQVGHCQVPYRMHSVEKISLAKSLGCSFSVASLPLCLSTSSVCCLTSSDDPVVDSPCCFPPPSCIDLSCTDTDPLPVNTHSFTPLPVIGGGVYCNTHFYEIIY